MLDKCNTPEKKPWERGWSRYGTLFEAVQNSQHVFYHKHLTAVRVREKRNTEC